MKQQGMDSSLIEMMRGILTMSIALAIIPSPVAAKPRLAASLNQMIQTEVAHGFSGPVLNAPPGQPNRYAAIQKSQI